MEFLRNHYDLLRADYQKLSDQVEELPNKIVVRATSQQPVQQKPIVRNGHIPSPTETAQARAKARLDEFSSGIKQSSGVNSE